MSQEGTGQRHGELAGGDHGATGGGNVDTGGGDFVGRDRVIHGDEVYGDKVAGNKIETHHHYHSPKLEAVEKPERPFERTLVAIVLKKGKTILVGRQAVLASEYLEFLKKNPEHLAPSYNAGWSGKRPLSGRENLPVTGISYNDAVAYCNWRQRQTGRRYRLLTVSEWKQAVGSGQLTVTPETPEWTATTDEAGEVNLQQGTPASKRKLCKVVGPDDVDGVRMVCFLYPATKAGKVFTFRIGREKDDNVRS